jgi:hypothetical protein
MQWIRIWICLHRPFLCYLIGHKMRMQNPPDVCSGWKCARKGCTATLPLIEWPKAENKR